MSNGGNGDSHKIDLYYEKLFGESEFSGYHLNSDTDFVKALITGILANEKRYGYPSCPCRLASGVRKEDLDIICPCDYRDADLNEYGSCFCALYVTEAMLTGNARLSSIPDRRPLGENRANRHGFEDRILTLPLPVWRCRVCGYLCAREYAPGTCPVCKASQERFERFL